MKKEIDNLLARYFGGNSTEEDMQDLEKWISSSLENQLYFDEMTNIFAKLGNSELNIPSPKTVLAKESFLAYISIKKNNQLSNSIKIKRNPFYKNWMFRAASITVIIMLSFSVWKLFMSEREMELVSQTTLKQEILPDQTKVALSGKSKITYSSYFSKRNKIIKLEGEANFKVGHAGIGKLQVIANETFIEDVGTTFKVSAYPDSNYISVKVREGKVHFYTKNNTGLILRASETGIYNKQTKAFKVLAQKLDTFAIGSMHVDFQAIILKDAIEIIGNAYKVNIKLADKSINYRRITVNFDGEDVNVILQIIAETLDLKVEKRDHGYLLSNQKTKL